MPQISETLAARAERYGTFQANADASQRIKTLLKELATEHDTPLTAIHAEAMDNIAQKLSRILCGDPNYDDNWRDIAGYSTLVLNILTDEQE